MDSRVAYISGADAPPADIKPKVLALPHGCIIGDAKEAIEQIHGAALSPRAMRFAAHVAVLAFGNAGYQQQVGREEPGLWCQFDLRDWTQYFGWFKPDVCKVRDQLVALGVIRYVGDPQAPGTGWIRFNVDYSSWRANDEEYRRARYRREGAGRPKQHEQDAVSSLITRQAGVSRLTSHEQAAVSDLISENFSNDSRPPAQKLIKRLTVVSSESAAVLAPRDALRKESKKEESVTHVTGASGADALAAPSASPQRQRPRYSGAEQAYIRQIVDAYKAELRVKGNLPDEGQVRGGARWFYRARDGDPVPAADVAHWYQLNKTEPYWQGRYLPLQVVAKTYTAHEGDIAAYERHLASERKRQEKRERYQTNGRPAAADAQHIDYDKRAAMGRPAKRAQPVATTAASVPPLAARTVGIPTGIHHGADQPF